MATDQKAVKVYLPAELVSLLEAEAKRDDRTVTAIVRRALRAYFAAQGPISEQAAA